MIQDAHPEFRSAAVRPVSRHYREPHPSPTRWWCSNCRAEVDGPWHERDCPNEGTAQP